MPCHPSPHLSPRPRRQPQIRRQFYIVDLARPIKMFMRRDLREPRNYLGNQIKFFDSARRRRWRAGGAPRRPAGERFETYINFTVFRLIMRRVVFEI